jgi:protein unc-80
VSEFVHIGSKRVKELYKLINDSSIKVSELLDTKAHAKLVEIAYALLKSWEVSMTLNGNGLQNYFQKLLPVTDWTQEHMKPAFNNLLRRLDRLFSKISKKPILKKQLDWFAIAGILNGIYFTLEKQEVLAHLPYFKQLITSIISMITNESQGETANQNVNTPDVNQNATATNNVVKDFESYVSTVESKFLERTLHKTSKSNYFV